MEGIQMDSNTRKLDNNLHSQLLSCFPNAPSREQVGFRLRLYWMMAFMLLIAGLGFASTAGAHAGMDPEIHEITEDLEKEPNRIDLWIKRGQVYRSYGQLANSLQDLEKAWTLDPDNKKVALERCITLSAMGRNTDAEVGLDSLLQQDLGEMKIFALAERASIRGRTGRPELAIEDYTSVLDLYPTAELFLLRGKIQESLGQLEEAAAGYLEGIAKLGDSILLKKRLIEIRIAQGKFDVALELIDEQLNRASVKTPWYIQRAEVLSRMGQGDAAHKTYEQALSETNRILSKRTTSIHLLARAKVLNAMGQRDKAVKDLQEAVKQSPQLGEAKNLLQQWGPE